ncbi:serine carboxypeptidase-like 5 [Phalaenopsis equestris]|uniref:serine carboxypeptidase-like 5 n=1 Tax=Phalaenopsis equestris TaxID=78828 RepID=UPI0009E616B9|nr:serine carboxypeptidase-like 5 [Phalaenopsis equestris]XP_020598051.1 serine carboxypeptidase-like 5 [Phalaenopsis equestris]XP_020598058.1 serine carboxypeptidase-like 5 [Phalaenopsis equestris]
MEEAGDLAPIREIRGRREQLSGKQMFLPGSTSTIYKFLIKWLLDHPSFQSNPFYVAGDSYGGKMAPLSALEIADGNEKFQQPFVNLNGYLVGNPVTG